MGVGQHGGGAAWGWRSMGEGEWEWGRDGGEGRMGVWGRDGSGGRDGLGEGGMGVGEGWEVRVGWG